MPEQRRLSIMTECANCGARRLHGDLKEIQDLSERIDPGSEVPAGECCDCGALCYLVELDEPSPEHKALALLRELRQSLPEMDTDKPLPGSTAVEVLSTSGRASWP
jgi:hypothetical protein